MGGRQSPRLDEGGIEVFKLEGGRGTSERDGGEHPVSIGMALKAVLGSSTS